MYWKINLFILFSVIFSLYINISSAQLNEKRRCGNSECTGKKKSAKCTHIVKMVTKYCTFTFIQFTKFLYIKNFTYFNFQQLSARE